MKSSKVFYATMILLVVLAFMQAFFNSIMDSEFINFMQTVILSIFVIYHGYYRYGWARLFILVIMHTLICWVPNWEQYPYNNS